MLTAALPCKVDVVPTAPPLCVHCLLGGCWVIQHTAPRGRFFVIKQIAEVELLRGQRRRWVQYFHFACVPIGLPTGRREAGNLARTTHGTIKGKSKVHPRFAIIVCSDVAQHAARPPYNRTNQSTRPHRPLLDMFCRLLFVLLDRAVLLLLKYRLCARRSCALLGW